MNVAYVISELRAGSLTLYELARDEHVPPKLFHGFLLSYVEGIFHQEQAAGREPLKRSWELLELKRRWLAGDISDGRIDATLEQLDPFEEDPLEFVQSSGLGQLVSGLGQLLNSPTPGGILRNIANPTVGLVTSQILHNAAFNILVRDPAQALQNIVDVMLEYAQIRAPLQKAGEFLQNPNQAIERFLQRDPVSRIASFIQSQINEEELVEDWFDAPLVAEEEKMVEKMIAYLQQLEVHQNELLFALVFRSTQLRRELEERQEALEIALFD